MRSIIEDPDGQVEPLLGIDGIEIHASPAGENHGLYRADDQMLLALRRIGFPEQSPPLILLRQANYGGLFDRLADEFDERWDKATPLTTREQLHAYLGPRSSPDRTARCLSRNRHRLPRHHSHRRRRPTRPRTPPRRWPGRRT